MNERLVSTLRKLGYTKKWLDYGVLSEQTLLEQDKLLEEGEDQNTEHYRYASCLQYLETKKVLTDSELANYLELLKNDPDTYMSGSVAIEVFNRIELNDQQFDWFSQEILAFGNWVQKIVLRQKLLRELGKENSTDELIHECILKGDSVVQDYLLDHCELNQSQLQELNIHGKNKQIRTHVQKLLVSKSM